MNSACLLTFYIIGVLKGDRPCLHFLPDAAWF